MNNYSEDVKRCATLLLDIAYSNTGNNGNRDNGDNMVDVVVAVVVAETEAEAVSGTKTKISDNMNDDTNSEDSEYNYVQSCSDNSDWGGDEMITRRRRVRYKNGIVQIHKTFDERYIELKNWIELHNRLPNRKTKNNSEKTLGIWVCHKRAYEKNGNMSKDQINKLNQLKYWWWSK